MNPEDKRLIEDALRDAISLSEDEQSVRSYRDVLKRMLEEKNQTDPTLELYKQDGFLYDYDDNSGS